MLEGLTEEYGGSVANRFLGLQIHWYCHLDIDKLVYLETDIQVYLDTHTGSH
jgi:hypothetical protein